MTANQPDVTDHGHRVRLPQVADQHLVVEAMRGVVRDGWLTLPGVLARIDWESVF
jgi:hypothetical protein